VVHRSLFQIKGARTAEIADNILLVVKPNDMDGLLELIGKKIWVGQRVTSFATGKNFGD
jgi:pyrroline-5-carboxylate reductase